LSRCVSGGWSGRSPPRAGARMTVCRCRREAAESLHRALRRRRCPALDLDVQAGTCIPAVTAEPVDSLFPAKAGWRRRERPWGGPPPGAAHHLAVTLAVNNSPRRLSPQLTRIVGPGKTGALLVWALVVHRHDRHLHPCLLGVQENRERWSPDQNRPGARRFGQREQGQGDSLRC
jgi:hypothetical protein